MPKENIGTSSTAHEVFGLASVLRSGKVRQRFEGKVVLLHMDSMCSVRNLAKGGGPVEELVKWVKVIWRLCDEGNITLIPKWLRHNALMMQRVDALSKMGTLWLMDPTWALSIQQETGSFPLLPDLSKCEPTVQAAVGRQGITLAGCGVRIVHY